MHMKMEYRLSGIQTGIDGETNLARNQVPLPGKFLGDHHHVSTQVFMPGFKLVQRDEMLIGYDQYVCAGRRMGIPEGCHQLILVEHPFGCPTLDNFTKDTRRKYLPCSRSNRTTRLWMSGWLSIKIRRLLGFFTPDERLGHIPRNVVPELLGGSLHKIRGRSDQRTGHSAVQCQLGTAHGIDHNSG